MYLNVLNFHGLNQDLDHDDFYETQAVIKLEEDVTAYLKSRVVRFAVLSGSIGSGKTAIINRLVKQSEKSKEYVAAVMVHNDVSKIKEPMITNKLLRMIGDTPKRFADSENRHEVLKDKIKEFPKILVVIDDAQKLNPKTLIDMKKTTEKGISILLAAHTQFARKIGQSMFEEVGLRVQCFDIPGIAGEVKGYLEFLLKLSGGNIEQSSKQAIDELCRLCKTPRQVRKLAWLALQRAVVNKEKQISLKTIQEVLPTDFSHYLVELKRRGYTIQEISEELMEDPKRIIQCIHGRLPDDDALYNKLRVFMHGFGIKSAVGE